VLVVAALTAAGAAFAASPGTPDLTQMALRATDMPGATVSSQGAVAEDGYAGGYRRSFTYATPHGRSGLLYVSSEIALANSADQATSDLATTERALRSKVGRRAFAAGLAKDLKVKVGAVTVGAMRTPHVGDHAFELPVTIVVKSAHFHESLLFMRLDRVVAIVDFGGARAIVPGESASLAATIGTHVVEGLTPVSVAAPSVTGTAQQGQTLTATSGTWSNSDVAVTYQWQRCDATGAACADVAGATASTYAVGSADAGATLRVVVTAKNRFGAPTAQSAVTSAVS
jgi:hypothetical protein